MSIHGIYVYQHVIAMNLLDSKIGPYASPHKLWKVTHTLQGIDIMVNVIYKPVWYGQVAFLAAQGNPVQ